MTAVEFLKQNLPSLFQGDSGHYETLFEQAKEMEKQQIIDAYGDGLNAYRTDFCNRDEYFAKTYGSKGSDTPHVTTQVTPQVTSSQQEISDEEIEKAALEYYESPIGNLDREIGFRYACKWYREQLK